jgi:hypothetical protein
LEEIIVKNLNISTKIEDPTASPYFLQDEPMNVAQVNERLRSE